MTSAAPVVLVAALVTGIALLLGLGSGGKIVNERALTVASLLPSRSYSYSISGSFLLRGAQLRQVEREMRVAGRLTSSECGVGAGGHRTATAPRARTTLTVLHGGLAVHLYVVGQHEVICSQNAIAGDAVAGPQQRPPRPAAGSISLGGVSASDKNGLHTTLEYGRAGAEVQRLSFVLSGGQRVFGAVGGGWFLVWWPSDRSPTTARLTTTAGLRIVPLGAEAASPSVSCRRHAACFATATSGRVVSSKDLSVGSSVVSMRTSAAGSVSGSAQPLGAGDIKPPGARLPAG